MEETSPFALVALPLAIALIMGSLGLSLTVEDFRRIFVQPRGILIGLANLFLLSPLLAFAVAELYGLEAVFAVGLVLLGASPGGATANLLTHLARGDTALSISMTALSSIAATVTVPLYLSLAIGHFDAGLGDEVSMGGVVARVFAITVVPVAIGMRIRARRTAWAVAHEPAVKRIAIVAFVVVVVGAVADEWETVTEHFAELAIAALTLNVLAMACSFTISRLARLDNRQSTAVAMELGVHNGTLAIAVAVLITDDLAIPAAIYSAFMFATAGAFARLMYRRNAGAEGEAAPAPAPAR
ncbi:MAG TPA: bile acid:sodium symporter family protein [Solirubrobacteraceae bacterium]|jgi:BASS family bile acid:Na+ symporter|nr:bile acid:sodium symporter family protein [Solirubrobacteraceae bacterium]